MKRLIRILLLAAIVVLGFTAVFPEWFDLKDEIAAQRVRERAEAEERAQTASRKHQYTQNVEALTALEPHAEPFADRVWADVSAGNYESPYQYGTARFLLTQTPAHIEKIRAIYEGIGSELDLEAAESRPGYANSPKSKVYLRSSNSALITESMRWSENAAVKQTLELMLEGDQLRVDAVVLEVLLYPDKAHAISERIRGPHVFR